MKLKVIAWVLLALVAGFVQELIKVNINYQLEFGPTIPHFFEHNPHERAELLATHSPYAPYDYYYNHYRIDFLNRLSQQQLTAAKWIVTALFVGIFFMLNFVLMRTVTRSNTYLRPLVKIYLALTIFAFMVFASGLVLHRSDLTYPFARKVIGALQSIIPAMLLYPYYLWKKHNPQASA